MDNSLFDDIIKNKLEDHVDPSGPSAAEMSRMLDSMPQVPGVASGISTATKIATAASVVFMITTIFLIYRTYLLHDTLTSVQHELIELGKQSPEVQYTYDTLYWDSLQHFTRQAVIEEFSKQTNNTPQQASFQLSSGESQKLVSQLLDDLTKAIEEDPDFREAVLSQLNLEGAALGQERLSLEQEELPEDKVDEVAESLVVKPTKTEMTAVLLDLASDSVYAKKLTNILVGIDPDTPEEDQLIVADTKVLKGELMSMSEEEQSRMIEGFSRSEPEAANLSIKSLGLDSVFERTLDKNEFLLSTLSEDQDSLQLSSIEESEMPPVVRKVKKPVTWRIGAGAGTGIINLSTGNTGSNVFHGMVERRIGDRIGILAGLEYQSTEAETYDLENFDFSRLESFETSDVKEIKTYLTWMDIPIEARFYVLPGRKINPFVGVAIKVRTLLSESYKVETNAGDDFNPAFNNTNNSLIFPAFGAGAGAQFFLNDRLNAELKVSQTFGGSRMTVYDDRLNAFLAQGSFFIRLSK